MTPKDRPLLAAGETSPGVFERFATRGGACSFPFGSIRNRFPCLITNLENPACRFDYSIYGKLSQASPSSGYPSRPFGSLGSALYTRWACACVSKSEQS